MTDPIRRYPIPCLQPGLVAVVWWNPVGQTYTARIDNLTVDGVEVPQETLAVWFGTRYGEFQTVEALQAAIAAHAVVPAIVESPGLSPTARRRARAAGPRAVAMRSDHQRLLRAAGFDDVSELDVTSAFAATAAAWLAETEPYAEELARLQPPGACARRQIDRRSMLAAIQAGLLRRALLLARTRGRAPTATGMHDPVPTTLVATGSTIANQRPPHRR